MYEVRLQNHLHQMAEGLEPVPPEQLHDVDPDSNTILVDRQDDKTWLMVSIAPFISEPWRIVSETLNNGDLQISHLPVRSQRYNSYALVGCSNDTRSEYEAELHRLGPVDSNALQVFTSEVPKKFMEQYTNSGYYPQTTMGELENDQVFVPQVIVEEVYGKARETVPNTFLDEAFKRHNFNQPYVEIQGELSDYLTGDTELKFVDNMRSYLLSPRLNTYRFKLQGEFDIALLPPLNEQSRLYRVNPETNQLEKIVGVSGPIVFAGDKYLNCGLNSVELPMYPEDARRSILRLAERHDDGVSGYDGRKISNSYSLIDLISNGLVDQSHLVGEPIEPAELFKTVFDTGLKTKIKSEEFERLRAEFIPVDLVARFASSLAMQSLCEWSEILLRDGPPVQSIVSGAETVYKLLTDLKNHEARYDQVMAERGYNY